MRDTRDARETRTRLRPAKFGMTAWAACGALLSANAIFVMDAAQAQTPSYTWSRAQLGGGGYVHGLHQHPNRAGVFYARGDVFGLLRWNPALSSWEQLMDALPSSNSPGSFMGCTGMDIAPNAGVSGNPDTVYGAFGSNYHYWRGLDPKWGIYKSNDGGNTWTQVFATLTAGNNAHNIGDSLRVDPNNAAVVYYGSQSFKVIGNSTARGGLFRSTNFGNSGSWNQVSSMLIGTTPSDNELGYGARPLLIDPRSTVSGSAIGVSGNVSKNIYLFNYSTTAASHGMYWSTDGGASFSKMTQAGSPNNVRRMALAPTGIYVASDNGLHRFDGTSWSLLPGTANIAFLAVTSDPADRTRIIARSTRNNGGEYWRSTNSGANWTTKEYYWSYPNNFNNVSWQGTQWFGGAYNADVIFDKNSTTGGVTPRVLTSTAFSVATTPNIYGDLNTLKWDFMIKGHESVVGREMRSPAAPSNTILHTGVSDVWGFRITDLNNWATQNPPGSMNPSVELTSFGIGEPNSSNSPLNVVAAAGGGVFVSSDDGASWVKKNKPSNLLWGSGPAAIAMSATNRDNVVYLAPGLDKIYYTTNAYSGGSSITWNTSTTTFPSILMGTSNLYDGHKRLAADKVVGGKFYLMLMTNDNTRVAVYVSTDGGNTWSIPAGNQSTTLPTPNWTFTTFLFTPPGAANEVWLGNGNGLFRSVDGAANFTRINNVVSCRTFCFGAPAPGRSNATLFVRGTVTIGGNNIDGIFRSVDNGATFVQINSASHYFADVRLMEGDRQVFGRVFLANGSGIIIGTSSENTNNNFNLVSNPSFEAEQFGTQTPSGWSELSTLGGVNAGYTESANGSKSGNYHATHWSGSPYNIYTYQTKTGLANGLYTLRAWAKRGGNQSACQLEAKDFGGTTRTAPIPAGTMTGPYQLVEITDINVTNGQCTFGVWTASSGGSGNGSWVYFDDVEFVRQSTTITSSKLSGTATASSEENSTRVAAYAVDGLGGTRWASNSSDPQWLMIDLGSTKTITRAVLNWETAAGRDYKIQVANSSSGPWTDIHTVTGNTTGGVKDYPGLNGSGRYVRMLGTARATNWGYSLWEFEVYGY